jgi:two-component system phosphate regulon sensor histidine kinase PhoR
MKIAPMNGEIELINASAEITIEADKLHLSNVVYNMLDNAIKYYKESPKIEVELVENPASIMIRDHGIGIPEIHLNNLFNKFFRVPTGNIHNVKGFGLGLYYVKNICDAHRWKIEVLSEEEKGTTFTIKF